jgi:hypothetical protein
LRLLEKLITQPEYVKSLEIEAQVVQLTQTDGKNRRGVNYV